ncbi:hypothetical protein RIF29_19257 [Crotalaria pallida]|uniref:Uncharacterized protein n=1 Tax=Crotalaria pallida TaxID=3830 RepID=A0AAN9F323_CROPI
MQNAALWGMINNWMIIQPSGCVIEALHVDTASGVSIDKRNSVGSSKFIQQNLRSTRVDAQHDKGNMVPLGTLSQIKSQGQRGKYKSFVVYMKIKGKGSKLNIVIPQDIDRAIGENARHLVNECGRVVRTKAPLNVRNRQEAFSTADDIMWKEIEEKFTIVEGGSYEKMYAFVVDTMQCLYRIWKTRLHYYYKSMNSNEEWLKNPPPDLPQDQWEYCVKRFGSEEFKKISERNSKNRLSQKRYTHTTGNLSFAEFEDKMVKQNKGVKPPADAIWLAEHTHENADGELEWADTVQEVLLEVLKPRSGYFRGKGTALRGYTKGQHQILQQKEMQKQQQIIQEQEQRIKELEEMSEQDKKELEEKREQDKKELEMIREQDKREILKQQKLVMDVFKQQMMEMFARQVE